MKPIGLAFTLPALGALAGPASAAELVFNGDFEAGAVGFTSGYAPGNVNPPQTYVVGDNPSTAPGHWGDWTDYGDHTSGHRLMMVVNGAASPNVPIWSQTVAVAPGAAYSLSFWGASIGNPPAPGQIQAFINGAPVGGVRGLTNVGGQWVMGGGSWNAGASSFATLTLVDEYAAVQWNDFSLDDISLQGAKPPPTPPPPDGVNLATNGDFEAGVTGFVSGYAAGNVHDPSTFVVGPDPSAAPGAWGTGRASATTPAAQARC